MLDLQTKNKAIELLANNLAFNGYIFSAIDLLNYADNETMATAFKNRFIEVGEMDIHPKF